MAGEAGHDSRWQGRIIREREGGALSNLGLKPEAGRSITLGNSLLLDCSLLEKGGKGLKVSIKEGRVCSRPSQVLVNNHYQPDLAQPPVNL